MNFNINNFSVDQFDFLTYLILFVLAFLGGLIFRSLMKLIHKLSSSTEHDYVLIPVFTISLMTFFYILKSSLPLSLGILGSLSIIRFRTPIRDLRDTFLLISMIAFCLLLGTENLLLAVFFLIGISGTVYALIKFQFTQKKYILVNIIYDTDINEIELFLNSSIPNKKMISTTIIKNKTYLMMNVPELTDMNMIRNHLMKISQNIEIQYAKN